MPNAILDKFAAKALFTITLDALANNAARQSTLIDNSSVRATSALLLARLRSGTAPTAGTTYDIYLVRANASTTPSYVSDKGGASDAAITIENAVLVGSAVVTATANKQFVVDIDTSFVGGLGPAFGVAVKNNGTGQALASAASINDATNATPIVIGTTAAHNFAVGDFVYIVGVGGNTAANGVWRISAVGDTTHFTLEGSVGNGAYTSGGTASGSFIEHITKSFEVQ